MMLIDKKSGVTRKLRRSHFEGLFAQVDRSKHHTSIEARISNVQVCLALCLRVLGTYLTQEGNNSILTYNSRNTRYLPVFLAN